MIGKAAAAYLDEETHEEEIYGELASVVDEMRHWYFRRRIIIAAGVVNAVSWLFVLLMPEFLSRIVSGMNLLFSRGGLLLVLPAFAATLLGVYAVFRLWFPDLENSEPSDPGVMQSYRYQADSLKAYRIWLVSSGAAAVNAVLLVLVYFYTTGKWPL